MEQDVFRFLRPWTQLLPPAGSAVVAVAGHGGCTTTLLRLVSTYRERGARVLVAHTVARAVPFALQEHRCPADADAVRATLDRDGIAYVAGPGDPAEAIAPDALDALARAADAEVVLVEASAPNGGRLPRDPIPAPVWPSRPQLALIVGHLGLVGRARGPRTVEGVDDVVTDDAGEVVRISTDDVIDAVARTLPTVPAGVRALPFLTGFGAFRDMDGMFAVVERLLDPPARPVVCFGELLGDERRDAADLRGTEHVIESPWIDEERVYAVYPAALDEE